MAPSPRTRRWDRVLAAAPAWFVEVLPRIEEDLSLSPGGWVEHPSLRRLVLELAGPRAIEAEMRSEGSSYSRAVADVEASWGLGGTTLRKAVGNKVP